MEIVSGKSSQDPQTGIPVSSRPVSFFRSWSIPIYARRYYLCFGGITFFLLLVQVITGGILAIYYIPSVEQAYASVYYIHNFVNYGWLIRSIHYWSANLMIMFIILHTLRVFVTGAYKSPREYNWVTGIFLFNLTFGFAITGGLLPWDQESFWVTTVMFSFLRKIPVIGAILYRMMVGNEVLDQTALTRFYSFHIMILPVIAAVLLVVHFYMVKKQGISRPL
jgi:quinol-cytochrome oxidoreductase complex cytochrome b subunit